MRRFVSTLSAVMAVGAVVATGCLVQTQNSVSGDAVAYAPVTSSGNASLDAVQAIMRQNCASCHAGFATTSQVEWLANGDVVAGNPGASNLFRHLRGSNTGGAEDMPLSGGSLTQDQIAAFSTWITNIQTP
jgi:mono/diheme cytochrome c family protein